MKARLELFSEFESSTKEAQRINKEREDKIAELIDKADTMIRGATTAGLSKSLEDTKDEYERRLNRTQWFFLGLSRVFVGQCTTRSRAAHSRSLATVFLACCKQCRFWVRSLALRVWKAHPRFARHMGNGFFCRQLCGTVPFVSRVRAQGGTR